jgi:alkanesulfonate monooxygenase SsuD/methylene tetrahydromethanopterin reductase-like flavin-dependent oxidoreductase (luciferase family)
MGGPVYLRDVAIPTITAAAAAAGRPAPRIVAGLPVCVTDDVTAARESAKRLFVQYGQWPSYRATLDRGGVENPEDVALIGAEDEIAARLRELATLGVTDFNAGVFTAPGAGSERTIEFLAALARKQRALTPAAS